MSPPSTPWQGRRLHFVGVGGAGLSGYARAAHALGATVTGSDRSDSPYLSALRSDGVLEPRVGHAAANVPPGEEVEVVYSSAVAEENPERAAARERGCRELPRAELLAELSALRRTIAVAGSHGKTSTASMITHALLACGADPGYLIGGILATTGTNAGWGSGEWLVVEADESDRSMMALDTEIAVVTNIELDHHATFGSLLELEEAFREFLAGAPMAVLWDRPQLLALRDGPLVVFDPCPRLEAGGSRFAWRGLEVALTVPGAHSARNAAGALEACRLAGADPATAVAALGSFRGARRRFELLGHTDGGAVVYDDYAHHPTEVRATLAAARTLQPRRLLAVFQPHLFSRTARLAREFGAALAVADVVCVLDVYPARERPEDFPGVTGRLVAAAAADAAGGAPVLWLPGFAEAQAVLATMLEAGDLCVVLGAGDVDSLGRALVAVPADATTSGTPGPPSGRPGAHR